MSTSSSTAATISDLMLVASRNVRAGRTPTVAQIADGGGSDLILANAATRTVERLREAHTALGTDRLAVALGTLTQASLRAVLKRLDAGRPGVDRMRKPELVCVLGVIAEGGNIFAEADALRSAPLGAVRFDPRAEMAPFVSALAA